MLVLCIQIVTLPVVALIVGILFVGLYRKIVARIQWRYGPPLLQPVIDIVRLFSQKATTHGMLFELGLVFSLGGALVLILFIPFGPWCPLSGSGGLLVILYLMLLLPLGIALSGGEGANPNISIGISRNLILALGYELPLLLILLTVMIRYESISIVEVVRSQQTTSWALFSWPLVLSGVAYLLILPAVLGVRPFDMTSAPQEISSGIMAEYGGKYLAFLHMQQALNFFIGIALFVNLFLGGSADPVVFLVKMLVVFVLAVFVHAVFPRFRIEQAVKYLWKWPMLLAFVGLIIVTLQGK
jgi:NADH-quinone oxidoreductase subunit H